MSGKKLTKEQEDVLRRIMQEWEDEVERYFEAHKDEEIDANRLDGPRTWELASIQLKYAKKANKELGMDYFEVAVNLEKNRHRKFSDMIIPNPNGFPAVPGRK